MNRTISKITTDQLRKCNGDVGNAIKIIKVKAELADTKVTKAVFTHSYQELEVEVVKKGFKC